MANNELQEIKDEKQKFIGLRKQLVGDSCKKVLTRRKSNKYNRIV